MARRAARKSNGRTRLPRGVALELPVRTILKVLVAALVAVSVVVLWPELRVLCIAVLLAMALEPVVDWLGRHHVRRGWSIAGITLLTIAAIAATLVFVMPPAVAQLSDVMEKLPRLLKKVQDTLPHNPIVTRAASELTKLAESPQATEQLGQPKDALAGLMAFGVTLVVTIYLLVDGRRVYAWLLAFVPRRHRDKAAKTGEGITVVVSAYVRGQLITSVLCVIFAAIVLSVFKVPAVLPLAVLAGVADILPVVGVIISTVPAVLLALTVSPTAGLAVAGLYIGYHLFESYVLVPRLYGRMMRLSTLTVLLSIIIGGALQGVWGAVMVLPIVAAYPVIEKYWLKKHVGRETVEDHEVLDEHEGDRAVDRVIDGDAAH